MGLHQLGERVALIDVNGDDAVRHQAEEFAGHGLQVFAVGSVVVKRGAGEEQGAAPRQLMRRHRRRVARGVAEADEHAQASQGIQGGLKGVLADGVIGDVDAGAVRELLDPSRYVLLPVEDHMLGAGLLGLFHLGFAAGGADDIGAHVARPLAQDQAHPAGRGMHQNAVPRLHGKGAGQQEASGQALEQAGRGQIVADAARHRDQPVRLHQVGLPVGAQSAGVGHPGADLDIRVRPHGLHDAGGFHPKAARQRQRIQAAAVVGVDVVHSHRPVAHQHLRPGGRPQLQLLPAHHFRTAVFVQPIGADQLLSHHSSQVQQSNQLPGQAAAPGVLCGAYASFSMESRQPRK